MLFIPKHWPAFDRSGESQGRFWRQSYDFGTTSNIGWGLVPWNNFSGRLKIWRWRALVCKWQISCWPFVISYQTDHTILYHIIPRNLYFDSRPYHTVWFHTTQLLFGPYYTLPYHTIQFVFWYQTDHTELYHTITYRMVPFVFWYQTARIWRIWQGPQRPVGILTTHSLDQI